MRFFALSIDKNRDMSSRLILFLSSFIYFVGELITFRLELARFGIMLTIEHFLGCMSEDHPMQNMPYVSVLLVMPTL